MSKNYKHKFALVGTLIFFLACSEEKQPKELPFKTKAEYEQTMIRSHQAFLQKEKQKIEDFVQESGLEFKGTGTGLRYHIYQKTNGDSLQRGDLAIVSYVLKSIEGDTLYTSPQEGNQEFMVDYDNVESGLHEGVKEMKIGEKGIFILPAHLAHGITGDQAAIPSQTTLVYDIHLKAKR